jgi:hypothetical protein
MSGKVAILATVPEWKRRGHYTPIEVPECPVQVDIAVYEAQLNQLVSHQAGPTAIALYPLVASGTALEQDMHNELKDSWEVFHGQQVPQNVRPLLIFNIVNKKVMHEAVVSVCQ